MSKSEYDKCIEDMDLFGTTVYKITQDGITHIPLEEVMKKETASFVETFFSFYDASLWLEKHLEEFDSREWELLECRLNYLGGAYRVGIVFEKKIMQGELFYD